MPSRRRTRDRISIDRALAELDALVLESPDRTNTRARSNQSTTVNANVQQRARQEHEHRNGQRAVSAESTRAKSNNSSPSRRRLVLRRTSGRETTGRRPYNLRPRFPSSNNHVVHSSRNTFRRLRRSAVQIEALSPARTVDEPPAIEIWNEIDLPPADPSNNEWPSSCRSSLRETSRSGSLCEGLSELSEFETSKGGSRYSVFTLECPICLLNSNGGSASARSSAKNVEWCRPNDCGHIHCYPCLKKWSENTNQCPVCRSDFSRIIHVNPSSGEPNGIEEHVSPKRQRVQSDLEWHDYTDGSNDPDDSSSSDDSSDSDDDDDDDDEHEETDTVGVDDYEEEDDVEVDDSEDDLHDSEEEDEMADSCDDIVDDDDDSGEEDEDEYAHSSSSQFSREEDEFSEDSLIIEENDLSCNSDDDESRLSADERSDYVSNNRSEFEWSAYEYPTCDY